MSVWLHSILGALGKNLFPCTFSFWGLYAFLNSQSNFSILKPTNGRFNPSHLASLWNFFHYNTSFSFSLYPSFSHPPSLWSQLKNSPYFQGLMWLSQAHWLTQENLIILRFIMLITSGKSLLPCKAPRIWGWISSGCHYSAYDLCAFIYYSQGTSKVSILVINCCITDYPKTKWLKMTISIISQFSHRVINLAKA